MRGELESHHSGRTSRRICFNRDNELWRNSQRIKNLKSVDLTDVPLVISTKFLANMTVLAFIANKGDAILLHSFPKGLRVNIDEYMDVLKAVVKHCMDQIAEKGHYVCQQDGAPAQNSKRAQDWLNENTSRRGARRRSITP